MDNFNVNFSARMGEVVDLLGSISELMRRVDVAYPTASKWVKEGAEPSTTNLIKIANAAGVNLLWLATGEGAKMKEDIDTPASYKQDVGNVGTSLREPRAIYNVQRKENGKPFDAIATYDTLNRPVDISEFVFIPRYNVKASAGHGCFNDEEKSTLTLAFRRYWVENYLHADPKDLSVIAVRGDSMEGVLNDGDNILINHAKNKPGDGLYVICIGEALVVKRTQILPDNKLWVTSANEAYEPFSIDLSRPAGNVQIIGKVEWVGRRL